MSKKDCITIEENVCNQINDAIEKNGFPIGVEGTDGYGRYYAFNRFGKERVKVIVAPNEDRAKQISGEYRFFDPHVLYYPAKDMLFYSADIHGHAILAARMEVIRAIAVGEVTTVVLSIDALMNKAVPFSEIMQNIITIESQSDVDLDSLKKKLVAFGYERCDEIDGVGQFAVRGGILDIFPMSSDCPYRIEFWGDTVDDIRSFDVESQRSIETVSKLSIFPASEMILDEGRMYDGLDKIKEEHKAYSKKLKEEFKTEAYGRINRSVEELSYELTEFKSAMGIDSYIGFFYDKTESVLDYFGDDCIFMIDDPARVEARGLALEEELNASSMARLEGGYILPTQADIMYGYKDIIARLNAKKTITFSALTPGDGLFNHKSRFEYNTLTAPTYHHNFEMLIKDIQNWKDKGYRIILYCPSTKRGERIVSEMMDRDVTCFFSKETKEELKPAEMMITVGRLASGYIIDDAKLVVITEGDIFGQRSVKKRKKIVRYTGEKIKSFEDLSVGDYVVHENHGLGIYKGIEQIEVDHIAKDYISIEYSGGAKLFILASQLDRIQKYSSKDGKRVRLNKLGGQEWEKTKSRVKERVGEIAMELVNLYAVRQAREGYAYGSDTVWQQEFEEMFPYEETEDQMRAINETKKDMESHKIMDRLICGDVGYGKTEVAIRAAFKAVQDGKQVAYLVPTTILAQQHFNTFCERMQDYPVKIAMLSRFLSAKEQKEVLSGIKKGSYDIVIGTHRLLSKDIEYKNLGLLIIDEEQRFGVTHKEKIKQMKKDVDVLTLTATPIPRTLHMSLIGIRDMSLLEEPPMDRKAIQTYVLEDNDELTREAISRELARGGQVYYVYNKVNTIADVAGRLAEMMPDVRIAYAHGKMKEAELENVMMAFINKEIDVLVTTTIIETGLDIPNVNTMIIKDADTFGLSQLYQLRGRVGRSERSAYAFLMYKRDKLLRETAEKRLKAIREFTDLGSGYKISMRDLEIRGAGNLLGTDQSGHMEAVGYDLYCKMLQEAVSNLKGDEIVPDFETTVELPVDAYIPSTYVKNEMMKLDLYKRISEIGSDDDYEDMIDEITDRFGEMPLSVINLLEVARIRAMAHHADIASVTLKQGRITFEMKPDVKILVDKLDEFLTGHFYNIRLNQSAKPGFVTDCDISRPAKIFELIRDVVGEIDGLIDRTLEVSGDE